MRIKNRKNFKRRGKKRRSLKKSENFKSNQRMVTYMPKGVANPFPPRYRTNLEISAYGSLAAATTSGFSGYCNGGNIYLPLSGTALPGPSSEFTYATLTPYGYHNICGAGGGGPYSRWRVLKSTMEFSVANTSAADDGMMVVVPVTSLSSTAFTPTYTSMNDAMQYPFSKTKTVIFGQRNVIRSSIRTSKLFGIREQAIEDDLSGAFVGAFATAPTNQFSWWLLYRYGGSTMTTAAVDYRLKCKYQVEFWNEQTSNYLST